MAYFENFCICSLTGFRERRIRFRMAARGIVPYSLPVGTRLTLGQVNDLDRLAVKLGCNRADVIRYLIQALLENPGAAREIVKLERVKKQSLMKSISG
jgi:hypothetical protein